ncbi:hypothetical protein RBB50_010281 [Rhinocladiella similis]
MATFSSPPGPFGRLFTDMGISHAAVVPLAASASSKLVITSGTPGVDLATGEVVVSSNEAQIHAAYAAVEAVLRAAGVTNGVRGAHKFTALLIDMRDEELLIKILRDRYPGHTPVFMAFEVRRLGMDGMRVELRAEAIIVG